MAGGDNTKESLASVMSSGDALLKGKSSSSSLQSRGMLGLRFVDLVYPCSFLFVAGFSASVHFVSLLCSRLTK